MNVKTLAVVMAAVLVTGTSAMAAGKRGAPKTQVVGVVNLNNGTLKELDQLPGVGEKVAKRIVEQRAKAPFGRVDELVKVKGFGKKKIDKLRPHLAVAGPTTIKVVPAGAALPATTTPVQGRSAPLNR